VERSAPGSLVIVMTIALAFAAPAFWVLPSIDDWSTVRPYIDGLPDGALRPGTFFRPIEGLLRLGAGIFPEHSALWMHSWVVAGHVLSVLGLYQLLKGFGPIGTVATCVFAGSSSVAAAVWSVDSAIQTWSTAVGLASVLLYRRNPKPLGPWLFAAAISALWKESGLVWFLLAPLCATYLLRQEHRRTLVPACLAGMGALCLYFIARLTLSFSLPVFGGGRYSLHLDPSIWVKNAAQLCFTASTAVDTVALLGDPGRQNLGWTTVALSIPLLAWIGWYAFAGSNRQFLRVPVLLLIAAGPHLVLGHVSEMYTHPVLAVLCLAVVPNAAANTSAIALTRGRWALALYALASTISTSHKAYEMITTGWRAKAVLLDLTRQWAPRPLPASVCIVAPSPHGNSGYSVFQAAPPEASGFGRLFYAQGDHRLPREFVARPDLQACKVSGAQAVIWFEGDHPAISEL
jgi:hypothetical protein